MQVNNSFFLTITFTLILLFGLTFVASSSVFEGFELSGDPFYFAKRQFIFVIIGIISMLIILNIPSHNYAKFDWLIIIFCFLLLLALFVPNIFQPDLGSVVIIFCVILSLLFLAGISIGQFSLLVLVLSVLAYIAIKHEPYRYARLISFTDPFAPEFEERSGYQLSNALIGIGRGEFFGVGLGNSIQKNLFLPEAHTDFLCFGIAILIAIQTIFNLGVNLGLLPTKGLTLPFVSYGGASLITFMAMIAIVLRIDYENRSY